MGPLDLIWLLIVLSSLQPVLQQKLLEATRQRLMRHIERQRNSRVVVLMHRQETMSLLGFPLMRYIDVDDAEQVCRAIQMTAPDVPLDVVVHTPGGLMLAALQIARAIKQHPAKTTVVVPHMAMSGGTLLALAADEILMGPHAVLGPVDPQLGQYAAASILSVAQSKPPSQMDDQTLILADQALKAQTQARASVASLLGDRLPREHVAELADALTSGRWTHDHPITPEQALELGLPVSIDVPDEFMQLAALYAQPVRRRPSVEYVPESHGANRS